VAIILKSSFFKHFFFSVIAYEDGVVALVNQYVIYMYVLFYAESQKSLFKKCIATEATKYL